MGMPGGAGGLGIGTIVVLGLIGWAFGIDPRILIGGAEMMAGGGSGYEQPQQQGRQGAPQDEMGRFAAAILGNTEDVWKDVLPKQANRQYQPPKLVLFSDGTRSGCGARAIGHGAFLLPSRPDGLYRPDVLPGHAAEVPGRAATSPTRTCWPMRWGTMLKISSASCRKSRTGSGKSGESEANQLSVRVELMADCLAGVWAHHSQAKWNSLEPGDIEQAIGAAQAIGDDRLQRKTQGQVVPDSFTHGSSAQRVRWLTGLKRDRFRPAIRSGRAGL